MSMAIAHFSIGVVVATILLLLSGRYRHPATPLVLVSAGAWAMAPDIHWMTDALSKHYHSSPVMNVFVGHHYLDYTVDPTDSRPFAGLLIGVMWIGIAVLCAFRAWRPHRSSHRADAQGTDAATDD